MDAVATPFVQGRLRADFDQKSGPFSVVIKTACVHCDQPLHIEVDSDMRSCVEEEGADPRLFVPIVDFARVTEPSISDVF